MNKLQGTIDEIREVSDDIELFFKYRLWLKEIARKLENIKHVLDEV